MINEVEKSLKAVLYDRLTSPLVGTYIFSWCTYNFKLIITILSSLSYNEKIEQIDLIIYTQGVLTPFNIFIIPAVFTALYLLLYPIVAKHVFKKWQEYIKDKKDIKDNINNTELLSVEQSQELRLEISEKSLEFERLSSEKNRQIQELTSRVGELEKENKEFKESLDANKKREELIATHKLEVDGNHLKSRSSKSIYYQEDICLKCFNDDPPKLSLLDQGRCHVCQTDFNNIPKDVLRFGYSDDFNCWSTGNTVYHCPSCSIKHNNLEFARLMKVNEDEYRCPLCKDRFLRNGSNKQEEK